MNKYDDTDYLIEREESIEYGKGTDTNVGSIEEDIKVIKYRVEKCREEFEDFGEITFVYSDLDRLENILAELDQYKKKIKKLEEENKLLLNSKVGIDLSYDDYIPKQKVEEILVKAEVMDYYSLPDVIEDLEKVLGVEDK